MLIMQDRYDDIPMAPTYTVYEFRRGQYRPVFEYRGQMVAYRGEDGRLRIPAKVRKFVRRRKKDIEDHENEE